MSEFSNRWFGILLCLKSDFQVSRLQQFELHDRFRGHKEAAGQRGKSLVLHGWQEFQADFL